MPRRWDEAEVLARGPQQTASTHVAMMCSPGPRPPVRGGEILDLLRAAVARGFDRRADALKIDHSIPISKRSVVGTNQSQMCGQGFAVWRRRVRSADINSGPTKHD